MGAYPETAAKPDLSDFQHSQEEIPTDDCTGHKLNDSIGDFAQYELNEEDNSSDGSCDIASCEDTSESNRYKP